MSRAAGDGAAGGQAVLAAESKGSSRERVAADLAARIASGELAPDAGQAADGGNAGKVPWPTGDDHQGVIDAAKEYVKAHPDCTEDEVIAALELPDMTGIPQSRAARTAAQRRAAARAVDARQHAGYAIRTYGQAGAGSAT